MVSKRGGGAAAAAAFASTEGVDIAVGIVDRVDVNDDADDKDDDVNDDADDKDDDVNDDADDKDDDDNNGAFALHKGCFFSWSSGYSLFSQGRPYMYIFSSLESIGKGDDAHNNGVEDTRSTVEDDEQSPSVRKSKTSSVTTTFCLAATPFFLLAPVAVERNVSSPFIVEEDKADSRERFVDVFFFFVTCAK